jgi:hypothetical protein
MTLKLFNKQYKFYILILYFFLYSYVHTLFGPFLPPAPYPVPDPSLSPTILYFIFCLFYAIPFDVKLIFSQIIPYKIKYLYYNSGLNKILTKKTTQKKNGQRL